MLQIENHGTSINKTNERTCDILFNEVRDRKIKTMNGANRRKKHSKKGELILEKIKGYTTLTFSENSFC